MPAPWEKYQQAEQPQQSGPWEKYADVKPEDMSLKSVWQRGTQMLGDVAKGFIKDPALAVATIAGIDKSAPATVFSPVPVDVDESKVPTVGQFQQSLKPSNTEQTLGAGLSQAAQMTMLGGAGRATLEKALATSHPWVQRLARIGMESLTTGAVPAAHGEDPTIPAVLGAGGALVTEAAPGVAASLKDAAKKQYQRALSPTTKINKATAEKITPEMMDRGIRGSLESIENQSNSKVAALNPKIDEAVSQVEPEVLASIDPIGKTLASLEQLKNKYVVNGKAARPQAVAAIQGVQDVVSQYKGSIDPESVRKLRQIFDDPVAQAGGYSGADLTTKYLLRAEKTAAGSLRGALAEASPDLAALNKEVSFWLDVRKVVQESGLRKTGQEGGLLRTLAPLAVGGAAGAGLGMGGVPHSTEGAMLTATMTALAIASRSPAWRTTSAAYKNSIADALAAGNLKKVGIMLGRFSAGLQGAAQTSDTSGQTAGR